MADIISLDDARARLRPMAPLFDLLKALRETPGAGLVFGAVLIAALYAVNQSSPK